MQTSALFGAKNIGFFEIYGESAQRKGVGGGRASAYVLRKRVGGINFSRFSADVFYGRPLIKIRFEISLLMIFWDSASFNLTQILRRISFSLFFSIFDQTHIFADITVWLDCWGITVDFYVPPSPRRVGEEPDIGARD